MPEEEINNPENQNQEPAAVNNDNGHGAEKIKSKRVKKIKPAAPPKTKKLPNRITKTAVFYNTEESPEFSYLDAIVQKRITSGITRDWSHFLRQCVDFAANYKNVDQQLKNLRFDVPHQSPVFLKDAFFKNNKSDNNE